MLVVDFSDLTLDFWNAVGVSFYPISPIYCATVLCFRVRANVLQIALLVIAARDDELERIDFYSDHGLKKPVKPEGMHAWQAKTRIKRQEVDSDEDA